MHEEEKYKILTLWFLLTDPWLQALIYIILQISHGRGGTVLEEPAVFPPCQLRMKAIFVFPSNSVPVFFILVRWTEKANFGHRQALEPDAHWELTPGISLGVEQRPKSLRMAQGNSSHGLRRLPNGVSQENQVETMVTQILNNKKSELIFKDKLADNIKIQWIKI